MVTMEVSVRDFVEYVYRHGDITSGYLDVKAMQLGTKLHNWWQSKQKKALGKKGFAYYKEQAFTLDWIKEAVHFRITGRADGLIFKDGGYIIEEIKTLAPEGIEMWTGGQDNLSLFADQTGCKDGNPVHWAQLMCYGYMFMKREQLTDIVLQLTYINRENKNVFEMQRTYSFDELNTMIDEMLDKYYHWVSFVVPFQKEVEKIKDFSFPFDDFRSGQRALAANIYRSIIGGRKLFVQAPTGIGKTVSTLFPAIKAMGEGKTGCIFYATAKNTTGRMAEKTLALMREKGLGLRAVSLTAKEKMCVLEKPDCSAEKCGRAKGHYDRVNQAIKETFMAHYILDQDTIFALAKEYCLCPYEFMKDLSRWAHIVVGDYHYVFDPDVRLGFLDEKRTVFLIDEAHNLSDRARDMYSANLPETLLRRLGKYTNPKALREVIQTADSAKDLFSEGHEILKLSDIPEGLTERLYKVSEKIDLWLLAHREHKNFEVVLQDYFEILHFLQITAFFDERYTCFWEKSGRDITLWLYCLDPSFLLQEFLSKGVSGIFFSATLTPLGYFKELYGGESKDYIYQVPSPFDGGRLCVLAHTGISTRYRTREQEYGNIAALIYHFLQAKEGNYMVFFPSYAFMEAVYACFSAAYPGVPVLKQQSQMTVAERDIFLDRFYGEEKVSAFTVLGGVFSEGIDLSGDRLIGAVVVGVGLPKITEVRNILRDYYQNKNGQGYAYAYMYPGMTKVLQAVGRVIRGQEDTGAVLLIDERYRYEEYKKLFPGHWTNFHNINALNEMKKALSSFWQTQKHYS